jgi:hypothetical protein
LLVDVGWLVLFSGFGCLVWLGNIPFIQNEKRISIFFKSCFSVREAKMWVFEGDLGAGKEIHFGVVSP